MPLTQPGLPALPAPQPVGVEVQGQVVEALVAVLDHLTPEHHVEGAGVDQPGDPCLHAGLQDVLGAPDVHLLDAAAVQLLTARHAVGGRVEDAVHPGEGAPHLRVFPDVSLEERDAFWERSGHGRRHIKQNDGGPLGLERAGQAAERRVRGDSKSMETN